MSMRVVQEKGYQFVQNLTTYALWVYKGNVCVVTAMLNGPMDRNTRLEILRQLERRRQK